VLCLDVELLTGRYAATSHNDRRRAEWPPHPARLFSAFVAALHDRDPVDSDERDALLWLESQNPPALDVALAPLSSTGHRDVLDVFVPVNDASMFAALEEAIRDAQERVDRLTAVGETQETKGALKKAVKTLSKAHEKLAREIASSGDEPTEHERKVAAIALGRSLRQVRTLPVVVPERALFSLIWNADMPTKLVAAFDGLCDRVTRLGHSSSLVRCARAHKIRPPTLVPDVNGTLVLRTTAAGQLARLEREHDRHQQIEQRNLPARSQRYAIARAAVPVMTGVGSAFSQEWIIYERVGGARPLSSRTTDLTRALRAALLEQHGRRDLSPVLSGHRGESAPSDAVHLAFVALPWLGHEHADASIQGCAIVSPRSLSSADRAHHTPACTGPRAHREHDVSDADRRRVTNGSHRHVGGVNLQNGDVDRRVAPGNRGCDHPAVRSRHGNFLVDVHRMVGGDDQAGPPVHAG